jgi:hypothetical protein
LLKNALARSLFALPDYLSTILVPVRETGGLRNEESSAVFRLQGSIALLLTVHLLSGSFMNKPQRVWHAQKRQSDPFNDYKWLRFCGLAKSMSRARPAPASAKC